MIIGIMKNRMETTLLSEGSVHASVQLSPSPPKWSAIVSYRILKGGWLKGGGYKGALENLREA